jgi:hypothetical protein
MSTKAWRTLSEHLDRALELSGEELGLGDQAAAAASAREALPHVEQNLDPSHPLIAAARSLSSAT